jgi:molybdate-binding protein
MRLLALHRPGRQALELLRQGLVHAAGLHFSTTDEPERNADAVRAALGPGHQLLRMARWQEGIATAPARRIRTVRAALRTRLTWVGREAGSGARQCLDRLFQDRAGPRRFASHHRGVAEAVRAGWADAGVCVRLASQEAGLGFLPVQDETYELCFPSAAINDRRIRALVSLVRSPAYRRLIGHKPGYDTSQAGELRSVE